jgi:hypothetical protein
MSFPGLIWAVRSLTQEAGFWSSDFPLFKTLIGSAPVPASLFCYIFRHIISLMTDIFYHFPPLFAPRLAYEAEENLTGIQLILHN